MSKTRVVTLVLVVDDDTDDAELAAWLDTVVPLRYDTGKVQKAEVSSIADPDNRAKHAVLVSDLSEPVEVHLDDNERSVTVSGRDGAVGVDLSALFDG